MILESIELENIRSYKNTEISFPRGITLFEGDNGSGKTSVLMGIEFALFGLGSQKPEALLAKKSETGSVLLKFSAYDKSYVIKRVLNRRTGSIHQDAKKSYLSEDGVKEPLSPSELKQRILNILKFNEPTDPRAVSRIFRYAVFTPQEEMKQILSDSAKRLEIIRRAFGVEVYKTASENAKMLAQSINSTMSKFSERFSGLDALESRIDESKKQISKTTLLIAKLKTAQKENETARKNEDSRSKELHNNSVQKARLDTREADLKHNISAKKSGLNTINAEIRTMEGELKGANDRIEKFALPKKPTTKTLSHIEGEIKKFRKLHDEINVAVARLNSVSDDQKLLEDELGTSKNTDPDSLEAEKNRLEKSLAGISGDLEEKRGIYQGVHNAIIRGQANLDGLQNDVKKIAGLGSKCPVCRNEITPDHRKKLDGELDGKITKAEQALKKEKAEREKIQSEIHTMDAQITEYSSELKSLERVIPRIREYAKKSGEIASLKSRIKTLEAQNRIKDAPASKTDSPTEYLTELKDALVSYNNSQAMYSELQDKQKRAKAGLERHQGLLLDTEAEISREEKALSDTQEKIKEFPSLNAEIKSCESRLRKIQQKIADDASSLAAHGENLKNEKQRLSEDNKGALDAKKWLAHYSKYRNCRDWIKEFFIPTVDKIEKQTLLSIHQQFNMTYCKWYNILIDDPTKESRIDENFTPIIEQDGYMQEINHMSGGERTSIALAYRLTLNLLMRQETESLESNLLILDEPTDGFSKAQLSKIRSVLDGLSSEQIILVSHEKELEAYVDNMFHVSKDSGVSRVSQPSVS